MKDKAVITVAGFALGARQGMLFSGLGMQKHRKITADRDIAARLHGFRCRPHDHPVAIGYRKAQQGVTHRAADQITRGTGRQAVG